MQLIKNTLKRAVLIIILISVLMMFFATPASYAKLDLQEGDFYYSGTTKGTYTPSSNIFSWLLSCIGDIADWLLGIITLGFRMVFVGWTALLEKILTWALESTTGVTADGYLVESSTDLTDLTDSSNNVTVEAIVYNRVAALDIDFFDLEYDKTLSGTGKKLICDKCQKDVSECVTITPEEAKSIDLKKDTYCSADCTCNGCDACRIYVEQLATDDPIIIKLRQIVSTWYSTIRVLAMAAMLVVLIAIGIKMALSTIASDKAVYKRMLVDWVVGIIILFAIHYFMIFVINMNEIMVGVIEESSNAINQVKMMQLTESESEFENSEIEIKVYEEIRTRAYDAKLINGTIGMVMYMTLVFFAFKYTIIYIKRYLTLLVLTLMGPGIAVAYALQKALSGKSQTLKTWMTEYIMNVIIQVVHALLYAVFISQALVLSLESVAGMVIALVLMNYTSKANELFKKIFKFGKGDSLLGHTENAMDSMKQGLDTAKGLIIGGKPMAQALTNTPYGKAVKTVGKLGVAGAIGVAAGVNSLINNNKKTEEEKHARVVDREMDENGEESASKVDENGRDAETEEKHGARETEADVNEKEKNKNSNRELDRELQKIGGTQLRADLDHATDVLKIKGNQATPEDRKKQLEALQRYNRFQQISIPTTGKIAKAHVQRLVQMENVFTTSNKSDKKTTKFAMPFVGRTTFNKKTMKFENDGQHGILNMYKQLSPSNLLGLTDQDKKLLKGMSGDMIKGLSGMAGIFFGMGTIVANPKVGMGLLVAGKAGTSKVWGKNPKVTSKKGKYTFSRFSGQSVKSIQNSALVRAKKEHNAILAMDVDSRHPDLADKLKKGKGSAITIGDINGSMGVLFATENSQFSNVATMAAIQQSQERKSTRFMRNTLLGGKLDEIDKHHTRQQRQQIEQFREESEEYSKIAILSEIEAKITYLNKKGENAEKEQEELEEAKKILEEQGIKFDEKTGKVVETSQDGEEKIDIYAIIAADAQRELERTRNSGETTATVKVIKPEVEASDINTTVKTKKITDSDIALLNKEIDLLVKEFSSGREIDMTSKKVQSDIIKQLETRLKETGVLPEGATADMLFVKGKSGLNKALKARADERNAINGEATKRLDMAFSPEEKKTVESVISEMYKGIESTPTAQKNSDLSSRVVEKVTNQLNALRDGSQQVNTNDGSVRASTSDGSTPVSRSANTTIQGLTADQIKAIEQHLQIIQAVSPTTKVTMAKQEAKKRVAERHTEKKDKSERNKKMQQAMLAMLGDEEAIKDNNALQKDNLSVDDVVRELQLSTNEAKIVESTVQSLFELKALNEVSQKRRIDKLGENKRYLQNVIEQSESRSRISDLKKKKYEVEGQQSDLDKNSAEYRRENMSLENTINKIEADRKKEEAKLKKLENRAKNMGPVIDITSYVKREMFDQSNDGSKKTERK